MATSALPGWVGARKIIEMLRVDPNSTRVSKKEVKVMACSKSSRQLQCVPSMENHFRRANRRNSIECSGKIGCYYSVEDMEVKLKIRTLTK